MTAKSKENKESKPADMSMMAQLNAQREVAQKIADDEYKARQKNIPEVEKELSAAKDKLKALEAENATLKLMLGEARSSLRRAEEGKKSAQSAMQEQAKKHEKVIRSS